VVKALVDLYGLEEAKRLLVDYYGQSAVGREELLRSPHRDRDVREFVDDIINDVVG
jgi:hypothetical protein